MRFICVLATGIVLAASWLPAGELLPAETPVPQAIDHYIQARLVEKGVEPAPAASDANLVRRLTLDLAGRIPTADEAREYCNSQDADKLQKLVERLLASDGFLRQQVNELNALLLQNDGGNLREYLEPAVKENRPWSQIFRELVEAKPEPKGSSELLKKLVKDQDQLANQISVRFFGINITCAKCHDHPLVDDWKQAHFFGMKSFVSRTFENGGFLGERDFGIVKFKTTKGEEHEAKLMFLTGKVIDEPESKEPEGKEKKELDEMLKQLAKDKKPPPAPAFSRRQQLVDVALEDNQQQFFAKNIVNRIWYRLIGQGLVMPLDQMHSGNPPSHPQLMAWLARDLAAHGYDLRRLVQGIVLSQTYARDSYWAGDRPPPELFAVASVRPLTPEQYGSALRMAVTDPESFRRDKPEDTAKRIEDVARGGSGMAGMFDPTSEDFQVSAQEALLLSNSERVVNELLADGGDRLIARLKQTEDRRRQVELAVWNVFSRPPTAEEVEVLGAYLDKRHDRPVEGIQQMVWALIAGSEFRFNY